jgi:hypothetical protein
MFQVIKYLWSCSGRAGWEKSVFHCFYSLHHQPPLEISKGDLELKKGIQMNQPFPLNSFPKIINMVYSKQIKASISW